MFAQSVISMIFLPLLLLSSVAAYNFNLPPTSLGMKEVVANRISNGDSSKYRDILDDLAPHNALSLSSSRRTVLSKIALSIALISNTANSNALDTVNESTLEKRLQENSLAPYLYGMETTDIYYPSYLLGSWKASSKTTNIFAPCGYELFPGGKSAYENTVQKEIQGHDVLEYKARFINNYAQDASTVVIADREYNAKEIAKAAMGSFSVVDVGQATPNRFSCLLAPPEGSGGSLIQVDILAIARKFESVSNNEFCCSEVVRQIVSPANKSNPNAPPTSPLSVKEIETISIYNVDNNPEDGTVKEVKCKQRTAMFLVPSQTDPVALKKWQMSRGQPVDVRYYDVTYSKI